MDKIDRLLEEVSLLQRLKQLKERVFKSGSVKKIKTTSNNSKEYTGPRKKEVDDFRCVGDTAWVITTDDKPLSKQISKEPNLIKYLKMDGGKVFWESNPSDKKVIDAIKNKLKICNQKNKRSAVTNNVSYLNINTGEAKEEVGDLFEDRLETRFNYKMTPKDRKAFSNRFIGFTEDGSGNYYIYDKTNKSILFWDHDLGWAKDEFGNLNQSNRDISFKQVAKEIGITGLVESK